MHFRVLLAGHENAARFARPTPPWDILAIGCHFVASSDFKNMGLALFLLFIGTFGT